MSSLPLSFLNATSIFESVHTFYADTFVVYSSTSYVLFGTILCILSFTITVSLPQCAKTRVCLYIILFV